jgi:hypothetical protein
MGNKRFNDFNDFNKKISGGGTFITGSLGNSQNNNIFEKESI